jgi:hypothetical protein
LLATNAVAQSHPDNTAPVAATPGHDHAALHLLGITDEELIIPNISKILLVKVLDNGLYLGSRDKKNVKVDKAYNIIETYSI